MTEDHLLSGGARDSKGADNGGTAGRIRKRLVDLPEYEVTREIIGAFFEVYRELGFGFLEAVCRRALAHELRRRGVVVAEEVRIEASYKGESVGEFRLDLLVQGRVVVELKAGPALSPTDKRQLMNYLRATSLDVGLLLHFGPDAKFYRVVSPRVINDSRVRCGP